jgi:hypothetical protein
MAHSRRILSNTISDQVDKEVSDIDVNVLTYLSANTLWLRIWSGSPNHSLASWIRIHTLTPTMWYNIHRKFTNWTLDEDGLLKTIYPIQKITFLLLAIAEAIRRHYNAQYMGWSPNRIHWLFKRK